MIRRAFRQTHRGGSQDFAVVEAIGGGLVTVRLATSGQRLTNLNSTNVVTVGEQVIVDYSTGVPYVRPVTIAEDEIVIAEGGAQVQEAEQTDFAVCWRVEDTTTYTILGNQGNTSTQPSSYLIPDFDQTIWGEESLVVACPYDTHTAGSERNAAGKKIVMAPPPGKWVGSFKFDIRASNDHGNGFPSWDNEIYLRIYTTHEDTWFPDQHAYRAYMYTIFDNANDTKTFTASGIVITEMIDTVVYPQIYVYRPKAFSPPYWPYQQDYYDYQISNITFDLLLIAELSPKPRSTLGSHWDEWYEKYPESY